MKKGASLRRLRLELAQKGVEKEIVERVIAENIRSDEEELQKIIAKKRYRYPDQQKFMQYLARQGFSFDDIKAALGSDD
jgi:SOS response regulatory protein OraA/RecX